MLKLLLYNITKDEKKAANYTLAIAVISTFMADKIGMNFIGIFMAAIAVVAWFGFVLAIVGIGYIENKVKDDYIFMKRNEFMEKYEEYIEE